MLKFFYNVACVTCGHVWARVLLPTDPSVLLSCDYCPGVTDVD